MDYVDQIFWLCDQYLQMADETPEPCLKAQAQAMADSFLEEIDLMAVSCLTAGEVRIHRLEDL